MKILLAILLVITFGLWGFHKYQSNKEAVDAFLHYNAPAAAGAASGPAAVKLDVGVLDAINSRLIGRCGDNKFGLTEEACIQVIKDRKAECQARTVTAFPEQPSQNNMQAVVTSHTNCLFQYVSAKPAN